MKRPNRLSVPTVLLPVGLLAALLLVPTGCVTTQSASDAAAAETAPPEDDVPVGYGTKKRSQVTGSVGTVDVEKAQRRRVANQLADLIDGNVSGVDVLPAAGGGLRIRIRGVNSFYGSTDPLYIVDGIAIQPNANGVLDAVNPSEVKSITVLKDAAAAIYGSRGANGVVVIETK